MGARYPGGAAGGLLNPLPANATETLALTTPPIVPAYDFQPIIIEGFFNILAGTGTTAIILTIRRGPLVTSPIVSGALTHTLAAGNSASIKISQLDQSGPLGPTQYSMTIQQVGATAAGTAVATSMWALPL